MMTDNSPSPMGKKNGKRNKRTASAVGKKNLSIANDQCRKFQPIIDGHKAFLNAVEKLSNHNDEFTWHDIRKLYHKDTHRTLTVEELNSIFGEKNMTKKEILESENACKILKCVDGSMMCRFQLNPNGLKDAKKDYYNKKSSLESLTNDNSSQSVSPISSQEVDHTKSIAISTDVDGKSGPTSDLSKSDECDESTTPHGTLSHQASLQSSITDDEGWSSGKENHLSHSPCSDEVKVQDVKSDDSIVYQKRIEAGSDEVDGVLACSRMLKQDGCGVNVAQTENVIFANSFENALEELDRFNETDSKETRETLSSISRPHSNSKINELIEKFDKPINTEEVKHIEKSFDENEHRPKSVYSKVLEEIGDVGTQINEMLGTKGSLRIQQKFEEKKDVDRNGSDKVVFRSNKPTSAVMIDTKKDLNEFVEEQKRMDRFVWNDSQNSGSDFNDFSKEADQNSDILKYFGSKMRDNDDLFAELGVRDCDGFTPRATIDPINNKDLFEIVKMPKTEVEKKATEKSSSSESEIASDGIVTVIERKVSSEKNLVAQPSEGSDPKDKADSVDSEGDIPYSLCSDDEGEPMTMIEKTMIGEKSKSTGVLDKLEKEKPVLEGFEKNESENSKPKTMTINVELEPKLSADVSKPLKERIAELNVAAGGNLVVNKVPLAKSDTIEDEIKELGRNEELVELPLPVRPSVDVTNEDGSMRAGRRHARLLRRGCCIVS